jgi:hypothetical protein
MTQGQWKVLMLLMEGGAESREASAERGGQVADPSSQG